LEENVHGKDLEDIKKDYVVAVLLKDVTQKLEDAKWFTENVTGHQKWSKIFQIKLVSIDHMLIDPQEEKDVVSGIIIVLENNVDLLEKM